MQFCPHLGSAANTVLPSGHPRHEKSLSLRKHAPPPCQRLWLPHPTADAAEPPRRRHSFIHPNSPSLRMVLPTETLEQEEQSSELEERHFQMEAEK